MRVPRLPHLLAWHPQRVTGLLCAALAALALGTHARAETEGAETLRLRVAWGGATPVRWAGRVSLSSGELQDLALLGRERDTPGSIWLDDGQVLLAQPRPRTFDGFDITAAAPSSAILRVELRSAGDQPVQIIERPLAELLAAEHRERIDDQGSVLLVHRAKDDAIRIQVEKDDLIFSPGDQLNFQIEPVLAGVAAGTSLDVEVELLAGRNGASVWSESQRIVLAGRGDTKVPVEIPLPGREGVYTVRIAIRNPPGNRIRFWEVGGTEVMARRSFQVVLLDTQPTARYVETTWRSLVEIDPANPSWWSRLPDWTRIDRWSGGGAGPLGSEPFRSTLRGGHSLAVLSASQRDQPSWRAYPLPGAQPGKPHIVEIDLPGKVAQQLAVRVYEADSRGELLPLGVGGGAVLRDWPPADEQTVTYRYLFWPTTRTPLVLLQNADERLEALYGKIRLQVAEGSAPPPSTDAAGDERLVAAYFSWDGLLERLGTAGNEGRGPAPVHDWATFYEASERLADYLELAGYNGAVVNVFADGSAAFEFDASQATPRLNSSRVSSGMSDLPQSDPLELLLRAFERRGLRLTPTLRLNATLPGIEHRLRSDAVRNIQEPADLPLWTDPTGRPRWRVRLGLADGPPHYRIDHEDVQREVESITGAVLTKYGGHSAFHGLGLELTADSFLALPPSSYGATPTGLTQFAAATGTAQKQYDAWTKNPATLFSDGELRRKWHAHRAAPSTAFYERLAAELRAIQPTAALLLLTEQLFAGPEFAVRPQLKGHPALAALYLERGVDLERLRQVPGVDLARVQFSAVGSPLADQAMGLTLNELAAATERDKSGLPSPTLIMRQPRVLPAANLSSPAAKATGATAAIFERVGRGRQEALTKALRADPGGSFIVGGPLGPGGVGLPDDDLLVLLRKLPRTSQAAAVEEIVQQPVVARIYRATGRSVCVVVNPSPWEVKATVTLGVAKPTTAWRLGQDAAGPTAYPTSTGNHAWEFTLAPYSVQGLEFGSDRVQLTGIRVHVSPDIQEQLAARCTELERRDLKPGELAPYTAISNPSFEQTDSAGHPIGWLPSGELETIAAGAAGQRALRLISTGDRALAISEPFAAPATGQLAFTAYAKAIELDENAELRLAIEEVGTNAAPRFIALTAESLRTHGQAQEWNGYQFGVEDLPLDSRAQLRVRLELNGKGEVWIDNLQLFDLVYPLDVYKEESDQQVLALVRHTKRPRAALEQGRYSDCLDQLDSYWSQFILGYLPVLEARPAEAIAPADTDPRGKSATPKLSDRLRGLFRF